jgi:hypothetical protein
LLLLREDSITRNPSPANREAVAIPIPGPDPILKNVFIGCSHCRLKSRYVNRPTDR